MSKKISSIVLANILALTQLTVSTPVLASNSLKIEQPELKTWYTQPAQDWQSEALPLGNGFMGAMVFGGVEKERIQTNEHTLWSGGPGASEYYNGGNFGNIKTVIKQWLPQENVDQLPDSWKTVDGSIDLGKVDGLSREEIAKNLKYILTDDVMEIIPIKIKESLQEVRQVLQDKVAYFSENHESYIDENGNLISKDYSTAPREGELLRELMGDETLFGSYQTLSDIYIQDYSDTQASIIKIEANSSISQGNQEDISKLFDGNKNTKWYSQVNSFEAPNYPMQIKWEYDRPIEFQSYSVTSGNDAPDRDPKEWILYGSVDGINYEQIDQRQDVVFEGRKKTHTFNLSESVSYEYFKLEIVAPKKEGSGCQLSEFEIIQEPQIVEVIGVGEISNENYEEDVTKLFDGSKGTKWYSEAGKSYPPTPTYPMEIRWTYDREKRLNEYSFTSANDSPGRDPKEWVLYGSNDGKQYEEIDARKDISFESRHQTKEFKLEKEVGYQYFKLVIKETPDMKAGCQLSEIGMGSNREYTDYSRTLNIDDSMALVTYKQDGVLYNREYFMSYPDNIMVIRLTADKPGKISKRIFLGTPQQQVNIVAQDNTITLTGTPADHYKNGNQGLKFAQQVKVVNEGGTIESSKGAINVENADSITLIMSAGTNYQQCQDETYNYFSEKNPLEEVSERIERASKKSFEELYKVHQKDYEELFNRVRLNIGNVKIPDTKPTDRLLREYTRGNTTAEDRYLELLYYQFGRYLLISSSREGTLPANLQGIWADGLNPPWNADYHTNINLQMNYWLAEQTNLTECHLPIGEYINSLVPRGRETANFYYQKQDGGDVRGWTMNHISNIWGHTGPSDYYHAFYFPAAGAWMCQDLWEIYRFTQDKDFLTKNYNILLDAALFWVDNLWEDQRDGTLVSNPSFSPEHGPFSLGTTADQGIIWELFDMVIKASEELSIESNEVKEIKLAKEKLSPLKVGKAGQLMEWKDETTMDITGDYEHRHVNHLYALHPGTQVVAGRSEEDNTLIEAMKTTLNTRGDGGTGWSKAWKINFWSRLRDAERSHKLVREILLSSTYSNLFDAHPPFQIDGNFGATAGMTEMLIQSQGETIDLLPALPLAWNSGYFEGLKARGNFEVGAEWEEGLAKQFEIKANVGGVCTLKYENLVEFIVRDSAGNKVEVSRPDKNTMIINTKVGEKYSLIRSEQTKYDVILDVKEIVTGGEVFEVTVGLDNQNETVYAQDFIIKYDPERIEFLGVKEVREQNHILYKIEEPGRIRVLVASEEGAQNKDQLGIIELRAKKSQGTVTDTTIGVERVSFGLIKGDTSITHDGIGEMKQIQVRPGTDGVDKSILERIIQEAKVLSSNAVIGDQVGQYPQASKDALDQIITQAEKVFKESNNQAEIDEAGIKLREAIETFRGSEIKEKDIDVNGDGKVDVADLALVAYYYKVTPESDKWDKAQKVDFNNDNIVDIKDLALVSEKILTTK